MTADLIYQLATGILLSLVSLFGGMWLRRLGRDISDLERAVERIREDYQRREDAQRDRDEFRQMLQEIKSVVNRLEDKLDRKADKQ